MSESFSFNFGINETPEPDTPSAPSNPDYLNFSNSSNTSSFEYAGANYTLQLTGFSEDEGVTIVDQFYVPEGLTETTAVYGKVTSAPPTEIPFEFSPSLGLLVLGTWGAITQLNSLVQKRVRAKNAFSEN